MTEQAGFVWTVQPPDHDARTSAVDTGDSFIVQAPAGSGKTMLLTERFLRLLATVDEPEQVLAITFTKAAVAEMRARALRALTAAHRGETPQRADEQLLMEAAQLALAHAKARGWNLLEDPQQLNISTIDSLALQIAQRTPLLSRLGPGFAPTEDAHAFYRLAALQTLRSLEDRHSADPARHATAEAALTLLRHRDNNLAQCTELIAAMLESRDQWGRKFALNADHLNEDVLDNELRPKLERDLQLIAEKHLRLTREAFTASGINTSRLIELACFAAENTTGDIARCAGLADIPAAEHDHLPHWRGLARLLLSDSGEFRRRLTITQGFPPSHRPHKDALLQIIRSLGEQQRLALHHIRELPPVKFSDDEWQIAKALFRLLDSAVIQLQLIFAEAGTVDFTEVSVAARTALQADLSEVQDAPSDLALTLSGRYQHLLVDEFQDTSITQFEILTLLLAGWEQGDGRSVFLVGDPMQSIYLFRQAEMRLFAAAAQHGLAAMPLAPLRLKVNFRSQSELVEEHNRVFSIVFDDAQSVTFAPSQAFGGASLSPALQWHFFRKPSQGATVEEKDLPNREEATRVRELVDHALANPGHKIAILVRAKKHAGHIMKELRDAGIAYRAIDMESLSERQEVLDMLALTRALLHPADRTAWLSVFRAPWCGLGLASLETICASSSTSRYAHRSLLELLPDNFSKLSTDEQSRARFVYDILREAWQHKDQLRLPELVWRTWTQLGGPACCNAEQYENVTAFSALLEKMDAEGQSWNMHSLAGRLARLCAQPNPDASARVELMTIHKAKGLGFDVVIVPHMDRVGTKEDLQAIEWMEQFHDSAQGDESSAFYLAPIQATGETISALSSWVRRKRKEQINDELKRLFYVAATRARHQLHLLGNVEVRDDAAQTFGEPWRGSLLHVAWPTIDPEIIRQQLFDAGEVESIAASGNVVSIRDGRPPMSPAAKQVRRLPDDHYATPPSANWLHINATANANIPAEVAAIPEVAGVRGSLETRARGIVLHTLLQQAAVRLAKGASLQELAAWAAGAQNLILRLLAAEGLPRMKAATAAASVQKLLQTSLSAPMGRWVLAPRPGALTEFPVTHWETGIPYDLRIDRIFSAGESAGETGDTHLWIVDYKSADAGGRDASKFLQQQAVTYAPTMNRYVRAWRALGIDQRPIHCALYFPAQDKLELVPVDDESI